MELELSKQLPIDDCTQEAPRATSTLEIDMRELLICDISISSMYM